MNTAAHGVNEGENKKYAIKLVSSLVRYLLLICVSFVILYPLLYSVSVAFRPPEQLNDPSIIWIPDSLTLQNVKEVWSFIKFPELIKNTLTISVVSTLLQTIVCCSVGYGLARFEFKEKKIIFAIVILTIVLPPQATSISNFILYRTFGILDTPLALVLPAATGNGIRAGLFIFIFRQFFKNLPKDLEDASYIDGCGPFGTFLKIMLPNAGSAMIIVLLFSLVWYWNDTYFAGMFLDGYKTISLALETLRSNLSVMIPGIQADPFTISCYMQAGVILAILPLLVFYIIMQRYFTESIARTGLVG